MAKKGHINIDKYQLGKSPYHRTKDPYQLTNPYRPLSNPYKNPKMRRGYNSSAKARSYSSSRKKSSSSSGSRYTPKSTYRPRMRYQHVPYKARPPPRPVASSNNPWTEPKSRIQPIRYQPNIEKMLKRLEKRFDKKLEQEVLEQIETEFEELKTALKEKDTASESEAQTKEIEAGPEEETKNQHEILELTDLENQNFLEKTFAEAQTELSEQIEDQVQSSARSELAAKDSLHEVAEQTEWLIEQTDNEESAQSNEGIEIPEQMNEFPALGQSPEPIETFENNPEQQTPEIDELLDEIAFIETNEGLNEFQPLETIELEPEDSLIADALPIELTLGEPIELLEQSADLEIIFDQIEPLENELMEPIEDMPFHEILPEIIPESIEDVEADAMEAGYY